MYLQAQNISPFQLRAQLERGVRFPEKIQVGISIFELGSEEGGEIEYPAVEDLKQKAHFIQEKTRYIFIKISAEKSAEIKKKTQINNN